MIHVSSRAWPWQLLQTGSWISGRAGVLAIAASLVLAPPSAAELPVGWSVEIFAGAVHDMIVDGPILVGATGGGLLLHDPPSQQLRTDCRCGLR